MGAIVEIDKAGRIVIPKILRDALHLTPGTRLKVQRNGDTLVFEPDIPTAKLVIRDGLPLIYPVDHPDFPKLTNEFVASLVEDGRSERERRILGLETDEGQLEILAKANV